MLVTTMVSPFRKVCLLRRYSQTDKSSLQFHHMKEIFRFFDHYGLLILLLLVVVAASLGFYWHWAYFQQLQSLSTFAVTVVLALVTWQYVRTTQKTLELFREQWEHQQEVGIAFGLKKRDEKPWIRIANTGGVRVFVSKAVFYQRDKKLFTRNTVRVVKDGENYGFYIPPAVYKDEPYNCDVGITLHYQGHGKPAETISKAFRIEMLNGKVYRIKAGIHCMWYVDCPKCSGKVALMITTGLKNYDEAYEREAEVKSQLIASCPIHQSLWSDTIEQLRERQKADKEKGIEE
jgi:hypothetical protein